MSLTTRLNTIDIQDPALRLFLQALAKAIDRINVNFALSYDESTALLNSAVGSVGVEAAVNLAPNVLIVKELRFLGDMHGLNLASALSMGCRAWHNAAQSITNNAAAILAFNSEYWDTDGMHDVAINNSRITFGHTGRYMVGGTAVFADSDTGARKLELLKNGATVLDLDYRGLLAFNPPGQSLHVITIDEFSLGDYVELRIFQNSGAALNVNSAADYSPHFWAHRLS